MTDYTERFRTLSIQQMQQVLAVCADYVTNLSTAPSEAQERIDVILAQTVGRTWEQLFASKHDGEPSRTQTDPTTIIRTAATQAHAEQGEQPAQKPISIESTCSECGRSKSPIDRCSPDSIDDDGECPYLTIERMRADADRAFVRGFAIAVAQTVRHPVDARDLLRSISATEALLAEAGVEEFDLVELRPALAKIGSKLGVEVAGGLEAERARQARGDKP